MSILTKTCVVITLATLLLSCALGKPILVTDSDNNSTYKIDYLFEHDGCKVYRFYDMGNYVYFTKCNGSVTSISNDSTHSRTITIADQ